MLYEVITKQVRHRDLFGRVIAFVGTLDDRLDIAGIQLESCRFAIERLLVLHQRRYVGGLDPLVKT